MAEYMKETMPKKHPKRLFGGKVTPSRPDGWM
jgi:hypothetical protein